VGVFDFGALFTLNHIDCQRAANCRSTGTTGTHCNGTNVRRTATAQGQCAVHGQIAIKDLGQALRKNNVVGISDPDGGGSSAAKGTSQTPNGTITDGCGQI